VTIGDPVEESLRLIHLVIKLIVEVKRRGGCRPLGDLAFA
jgi:hypothetical protein